MPSPHPPTRALFGGAGASGLAGVEEGDEIRWAWTASGAKLRREVLHAGTGGSVRRDYAAGGFVYAAGGDSGGEAALKYFSTGEGRAVATTGGGFEYEYHLSDHLGNTRVAFVAGGGSNAATMVQEKAYYPFGMEIGGLDDGGDQSGTSENPYRYNGKELLSAHGLRWYHYGRRFYDPQLGRWNAIDPADEFHSQYTYVGNDPISNTDPNGAQHDNVIQQQYNEKVWNPVKAKFESWFGWMGGSPAEEKMKSQRRMRMAGEALRPAARVADQAIGASDFAAGPGRIGQGALDMSRGVARRDATQFLGGADQLLQGAGDMVGAVENAAVLSSLNPAALPATTPVLGVTMPVSSTIDFLSLGVIGARTYTGDIGSGEAIRRSSLKGASLLLPGRINTGASQRIEEAAVGYSTRQLDEVRQSQNGN